MGYFCVSYFTYLLKIRFIITKSSMHVNFQKILLSKQLAHLVKYTKLNIIQR